MIFLIIEYISQAELFIVSDIIELVELFIMLLVDVLLCWLH